MQLLSIFLIAIAARCYSQQITSFSLIDTVDDSVIRTIENGDTIDISIDGNQLSMRADTSGSVGSVQFTLDGGNVVQTENAPPYALNGDTTGDYRAQPILTIIGSHWVSYCQSYSLLWVVGKRKCWLIKDHHLHYRFCTNGTYAPVSRTNASSNRASVRGL
jgi:hypothetical protein